MQRTDLLSHRLIHPGARLDRNRQSLAHLSTKLFAAQARGLRRETTRLEQLRQHLGRVRPATAPVAARLLLTEQRLASACRTDLSIRRSRLGELAAALAQLSPQATLARGYSIVRDGRGHLIQRGNQLAPGDAVELHFAEGWAKARIDEVG